MAERGHNWVKQLGTSQETWGWEQSSHVFCWFGPHDLSVDDGTQGITNAGDSCEWAVCGLVEDSEAAGVQSGDIEQAT